MTQTSKRLTARAAARQRQAKANEEQRHHEQTELDRATDFELARMRRDNAAATVVAYEIEMARQIGILVGLGNSVTRVAELIGEPEPEIKRLRKLADSDANQDADARLQTELPRRNRRRKMPVKATAEPAGQGDAEQFASTDPIAGIPLAPSPDSDGSREQARPSSPPINAVDSTGQRPA